MILDWTSPSQWHGWYAFRWGIVTEVTAATKDALAAKGLLRHASVSTTMAHYIKDVPEATRCSEYQERACQSTLRQPSQRKGHGASLQSLEGYGL